MTPALWGLMTALGWGAADMIARYTGRALGPATALFGMLAASAPILTVIALSDAAPLDPDLPAAWPGLLFLGVTGLGVTAATLLLYWGLTRGPVTVVAPLAGSYPALNLVLAVVLGARPGAAAWVAIAAVMLGVLVVARAAKSFEDGDEFHAAALRRTVFIALAAALCFAVTVAAAQEAAALYGELTTVWLGRWISLVAVVGFLIFRRLPLVPARRWWPLLLLQGVLDGGAYVALVSGGTGEGGAIVAVVASAFSAVTVLLARLLLREAMTTAQWAGIALIVGGVAALSAA